MCWLLRIQIWMTCPQKPSSWIGGGTMCPVMMYVSLMWISSLWLINRTVMTTWWGNFVSSCNSWQDKIYEHNWRQQTTYKYPFLSLSFLFTWFGFVLCVWKDLFVIIPHLWYFILASILHTPNPFFTFLTLFIKWPSCYKGKNHWLFTI